jgi:putative NADH-flavin reductase
MWKQEAKNIVVSLVLIFTGLSAQPIKAADEKSLVVFGASGRIGDVIVLEALARGHRVTGVSRNPEKLLISHRNFTAAIGDLNSVESIRQLAKGARAFVISVSARAPDNRPENSLLVKVTENIHAALENMEDKPYIVQVGGANLMYGSSYEEVKLNMQNAPFDFEKGSAMHAVLFGHQISVEMYRAGTLAWTVAAPPMKILGIYGKMDKTTTRDTFRTSTSGPLADKQGKKTIYVRDFAKAVVDEVENRNYAGQIFTVAY